MNTNARRYEKGSEIFKSGVFSPLCEVVALLEDDLDARVDTLEQQVAYIERELNTSSRVGDVFEDYSGNVYVPNALLGEPPGYTVFMAISGEDTLMLDEDLTEDDIQYPLERIGDTQYFLDLSGNLVEFIPDEVSSIA